MLSFENDRTSRSNCRHLPTVEIKYYNVIIDGKNFFDQPIKSKLKTYENIRKNLNWQRRRLHWLFIRLFLFSCS